MRSEHTHTVTEYCEIDIYCLSVSSESLASIPIYCQLNPVPPHFVLA